MLKGKADSRWEHRCAAGRIGYRAGRCRGGTAGSQPLPWASGRAEKPPSGAPLQIAARRSKTAPAGGSERTQV
jgi:hypothetical protein